jgi:hypothetical protein
MGCLVLGHSDALAQFVSGKSVVSGARRVACETFATFRRAGYQGAMKIKTSGSAVDAVTTVEPQTLSAQTLSAQL